MDKIIKYLEYYKIRGWICGGTARDVWLGSMPKNIDVAVDCDLATLREKLSSNITAINDYSTCVTLRYKDQLYHLYPLKKIELINTYYNFSFTNSLIEDSLCRDFTINSLYYDVKSKSFIDHQGAERDFSRKTIKFVGDANTRILESKIRLLRAPILAAILGHGWTIDPDTKLHIKQNKLKVATINPKQINAEIVKLLTRAQYPSKAFELMLQLDLLNDFFPELERSIGIEQSNKAENLDLFRHIMLAIDSIDPTNENCLLLRLAALLHDIGKPYTETRINGELHFYNHENVGANLAEKILYRWGFTKIFINKVINLIQNHLFDASPNKSIQSVKKLVLKVGTDSIHDLLDLRIADRLGTGRHDIKMTNITDLREKVNQVLLEINPSQFKLAIEDKHLKAIIGTEDYIDDSLIPAVKDYLLSAIITNKTINTKESISKEIKTLQKVKCPLGKKHLFDTWKDIVNESPDVFSDGKLKCGIYCSFICDKLV
jgi:putative nucleotidyltransferase with HDIG domain